MARFTTFINGQRYRISMSDVSDYYYQDKSPIEDIIHYEVELQEGEWYGTIHAWIENPSQHTLHLIERNRCYITINCRNFRGHGPRGYHIYREWDPEDPRKKPEWNDMSHSSGLGRGSYRFHKKWSLCSGQGSLIDNETPILVTDPNDIDIPFHYSMSRTSHQWGVNYEFANVHGYPCLERYSDQYKSPYRNQYHFDFRLALLSSQSPNPAHPWSSHMRVYQTKSKITRLAFEH